MNKAKAIERATKMQRKTKVKTNKLKNGKSMRDKRSKVVEQYKVKNNKRIRARLALQKAHQ